MKIVFLSPYPNAENSKDGMVQRVKHVDNIFKDHQRIYLDVQLRKNFRRKQSKISALITSYQLNTFVHIRMIKRALTDCDKIYVHSIVGFLYIFWALPSYLNFNKVVLDAHGIVPEELRMVGSKKFKVFSIIEKLVFSKLNKIICVTNSMKDHFLKKYPSTAVNNYFVYNILPSFNVNYDIQETIIVNEKINVIYSGNLQGWQNIDLMLMLLSKNDSPNISYTILTGEPEAFEERLKNIKLKNAELHLLSVKPEDLPLYYAKAHYGFILRDDIDVNRVASPTKLIEYLAFGIIPIVKTPYIGDFYCLGYEYITYDNFAGSLLAKKSLVNKEIYAASVEKMKLSYLERFVIND